jgi:hypothetical protein
VSVTAERGQQRNNLHRRSTLPSLRKTEEKEEAAWRAASNTSSSRRGVECFNLRTSLSAE